MRPDRSLLNITLMTASVQVVQYQVITVCAIPGTVVFEQTHLVESIGELTLFP